MNIELTTQCGVKIVKENCKPMNAVQKRNYSNAIVGSTISTMADRYHEDCIFYVISEVKFI